MEQRFHILLVASLALHVAFLVTWRSAPRAEAAARAETFTIALLPPARPVRSPAPAPRPWTDRVPDPPDRLGPRLQMPPPPRPPTPRVARAEILEEPTRQRTMASIEPLPSALAAPIVEVKFVTPPDRLGPPLPPKTQRAPAEAAPRGPVRRTEVRSPRQGGGPEVTYRARLAALVRRHKYYPFLSRSGVEGSVTVGVVVLSDGKLQPLSRGSRGKGSVEVVRSSGAPALDRAAIRTVLQAARRFPPFPREMRRERLEVKFSFVYRLQDR